MAAALAAQMAGLAATEQVALRGAGAEALAASAALIALYVAKESGRGPIKPGEMEGLLAAMAKDIAQTSGEEPALATVSFMPKGEDDKVTVIMVETHLERLAARALAELPQYG